MGHLGNLSEGDLTLRLKSGDLLMQVGPYAYRLQTGLSDVMDGISLLYRDFTLPPADSFADYNVSLDCPGPLSRLKREVIFRFDHQQTFGTIPMKQAYAFMEWGMNWCVSIHANEYLKLHAAVVSGDKGAVIMPGVPGAGKSTLCAALALSGWRVLSDEHALVPPGTTDVVPLCRPVSLKNESLEVIRNFDSTARFGPVSEDTHKGLVAHMKADMHPLSHDASPVPVRAMVFPQYSQEERQALRPRSKSRSFILAAYHAFNYSLLGETGFDAMVKLIDSVECYDLTYRDLDWGIRAMEELYTERMVP
jgi:HprK-related kinase A